MASFKKLDSGKWLVKFYCKDHNGNNRQVKKEGLSSKKEAQQFMDNYLAKYRGIENITINQLINEFLEYKKNRKQNTKIGYNRNINYILSNFNSDILVASITEKQLLTFLNKLNDRPKAQKNLKAFLSSLFEYAITYHNLKANPIKKIKLESIEDTKQEKEIYTLEDFKILDNLLINHKNKSARIYFNLLYFSGARPGEIASLTVKDIDFNNNTININKTRISLKFSNTPKNKSSYRIITIPKNVMDLLREYTTTLPNIEDLYIFNLKDYYSIELRNMISKNNLAHITLHGFRHSHASLLIKRGIPITDISKRLGHKNPQITLSTYSHFYNDTNDNIINLLENL